MACIGVRARQAGAAASWCSRESAGKRRRLPGGRAAGGAAGVGYRRERCQARLWMLCSQCWPMRSAHSPARCWLGDSGSGDERLRVGRRWVTVAPEPTAAGSRSRALQLQGSSAFTALHGISSVSLSRTRLQRPARTIHCASADHLGPLLQSRYAASPRFRHRAFPPLPLLLLSVSRAAVTAQCHWG